MGKGTSSTAARGWLWLVRALPGGFPGERRQTVNTVHARWAAYGLHIPHISICPAGELLIVVTVQTTRPVSHPKLPEPERKCRTPT